MASEPLSAGAPMASTAPALVRRGAFGAVCVMFAAAGAEAQTVPCRVVGIPTEVRCGSVHRPLDPAHAEGTTIDVHYVVVPATARRKLPDAVWLLAGGPGQSAIAAAASVLPLLARLNNRRDIVFVDQRGTGRSAPLECEDPRGLPLAEQVDPQVQEQRLLRCRERLARLPWLGGEAGLRYFTTWIAMQDLEAVRQQLGGAPVNLVGGSYGTRAALDYMRQYPQGVRRVVLDGVTPPDMALPAASSADSQAAFEAMLAACEAEPACANAFAHLRADWAAMLRSLPLPVTVADPLSGSVERLMLTREMLLELVRGLLYQPVIASALPAALHEASQGRLQGLLGLASLAQGRRGTPLAMGMHLCVVCAEDVPRMAGSPQVAGADFGTGFAAGYARICENWPRGDVPAAFFAVPPSAVPVLMFSGGADPATPPRHAARVAAALGPKALHVVVPNAGHGVMGIGCARDLIFRFVDAGSDAEALALDAECAKHIPRPGAFLPPQSVPGRGQ